MTAPPSAPPPPGLEALHPANFAMVMATGIVSIAAFRLGYQAVGVALFAVNLAAYPALWALTLLKIARHPGRVAADLTHHGRAVAFLTVVAATCVLGSQCLLIADWRAAAVALWIAGVLLWAGLTYGLLLVLTVKETKPPLPEGLNGAWLLFVVAAQSVAVLGVQVAPSFGGHERLVCFFSLAVWLGGGVLYLWIIVLIFYRYTFFPMSPSDLAPPYWINMGAVAISTLAGALLAGAAMRDPLLESLLPFLRGLTLLFWATATWWIPMLLLLGVWRHLRRRFPLRYDPLYWGLVFPLGMYTAATLQTSKVLDAEGLAHLAAGFVFVAFLAWAATFAGLALTLARRLRRR